MFETFLTPPEASAYLKEKHGVRRTPATLAKLRVVGGGPPFRKLNRSVFYAPADLAAWSEKSLGTVRNSTSDVGRAA